MVARLLSFHFFFFSSRRRHTRSKRDWSSDVCSSDLLQAMTTVVPRHFVEEFCDKARALGPRPDNTHITLQNIEKLGQFVQAGPAQEDSERSASRVAWARPARHTVRRGSHRHGSELILVKPLP